MNSAVVYFKHLWTGTAANSKAQTRFSLHPLFVVIIYFLCITLTGYAIANAQALKALFRLNSSLSHLTIEKQESHFTSATVTGASFSVLFNIVAGVLLDLAGPKITVLLSQFLFLMSWVFMYMLSQSSVFLVYLGTIFSGASFAGIFLSHTSLAALFPYNRVFVLAVIGAAPDISLIIPSILAKVAEANDSVKGTIGLYLIVIVLVIVVESMFVPSSLFRNDEDYAIKRNSSVLGKRQLREFFSSLKTSIMTLNYWLFALIYASLFVRKTLYFTTVDRINDRIVIIQGLPAQTAVDWTSRFASVVWASVIPAVLFGIVADYCGPIITIAILNTCAVLVFLCASIPVIGLQFVTYVSVIILASYIVGSMLAFLTKYYGFESLGVLQAVMNIIAYVFIQLITVWDSYITPNIGGYIGSNIVWSAIGIAIYGLIGLLWYRLRGMKSLKMECEPIQDIETADSSEKLRIEGEVEMGLVDTKDIEDLSSSYTMFSSDISIESKEKY